MKKRLRTVVIACLGCILIFSCQKESALHTNGEIDYFDIVDKPKSKWNELDTLCDSIYREFGVKIIYEYTPKMIRQGQAFYYPPNYEKALAYTRLMLAKFWLDPLKKNFPKYFKNETPVEYVLMGGGYHNDPIDVQLGQGAGFNGQFYRLGMGSVNEFDQNDKAWLHNHLVILWHEHAHNQDVKYGRGEVFDRISVGTHYNEYWITKSMAEAHNDGFFRPYGGFAPVEDFATTVEHLTRYPKQEVLALVETNEKFKSKYALITKFYMDKGMDLHRLQVVCDSVVNQTNY